MEEAKTTHLSHGPNGPMPEELKKWNWGAFLMSWIWAIAHRVWIGLLALVLIFIPAVGTLGALIVAIVLGLKGNEWAWQNRKFRDVAEFKAVQKVWTIWGVVFFVLGLIVTALFFSAIVALIVNGGSANFEFGTYTQ